MSENYSVAEVARRLNVSVSTVNRRLDDETLTAIPGRKPRRVDAEIVDVERAALLSKIGAVEPLQRTPSSKGSDGQSDHMRARVSELEGALNDLIAAHDALIATHSALLNAFRRVAGTGRRKE